MLGQAVGERHDDGEDHRRRAYDGRTDQHRLGRRLEGITRAVVLLQQFLGQGEIRRKAEVTLDLLRRAGQGLDHGKLVNALGVVGHWAIGVHGDRHRAHAEEAECHQSEGEDGRGLHDVYADAAADEIGDCHQPHDRQAQPIGAEVAGGEAGEDVQRGPAFARRIDDLADVAGMYRGKNLHHFRDDGGPASVPQVMIVLNFHHKLPSPPRLGISSQLTR